MSPSKQLKRIEFLVLTVLADGERHGYGIVQEVAERSDGRVELRPGNLYRVLDRLMERGLVEEGDSAPTREGGAERRRFYRITKVGLNEAKAEAEVLIRLLDASSLVLGADG